MRTALVVSAMFIAVSASATTRPSPNPAPEPVSAPVVATEPVQEVAVEPTVDMVPGPWWKLDPFAGGDLVLYFPRIDLLYWIRR